LTEGEGRLLLFYLKINLLMVKVEWITKVETWMCLFCEF
jgi:hypothetical protein